MSNDSQTIYVGDICRLVGDEPPQNVSDKIIVEQAVTIMIDKVGSFTIMCTPSDLEALAVGFVFSEGMIDGIDDVIAISRKPHLPNAVGITVEDPTQIAIKRNMIVASSCGMCGARNIEKLLADVPVCENSLQVDRGLLREVTEQLLSHQELFQLTGGSHGAAVFDAAGKTISCAEDIGRHTALDKAIGKCLIERKPTKGFGAALSGRVSFEMVVKAARAGIELIVGVSAPSSLAIEAAQKWNITVCGFVRQERANIYTHPDRVRV